jgi:glutamyl-tRNA reductase
VSVLVVGLSYRTAPIGVLERAALSASTCRQLERVACLGEHVAEAVVLATCNRLEVYADVSRFHGGVAEVSQGLANATGVSLAELTDHLYVHYEGAAVAHLFGVACGLDSMAIGEQQILGQVRSALREATDGGGAGRILSSLLQQALRVGKRAHSETGLDRAGHSLVEAGLEAASAVVGPLEDAAALVVGAGTMSGLAVATLARAGIGRLTVVNRTPERARRLAESAGGRAADLADLPAELATADVVISCTGVVGYVIAKPAAGTALAARDGRAQVYVDLALPRDVDPEVDDLPGATVVDLERLGRHLAGASVAEQLDEVRELVAEEASAYLSTQRAEAVAPTVVALRALAGSVVETELARLSGRLGDVDGRVRAEVRLTVHRVVEKLLHTPTVRVKELAGEPGGSAYAEALRELFGLDPDRVAAVSRAPAPPGANGSLPLAAGGQPAPPTEHAGLVTGSTTSIAARGGPSQARGGQE